MHSLHNNTCSGRWVIITMADAADNVAAPGKTKACIIFENMPCYSFENEMVFNKTQLDCCLLHLASVECGHSKMNGITLKLSSRKLARKRSDGTLQLLYRCAFFTECKCPWQVEVTSINGSTEQFVVKVGPMSHLNHHKISNCKKGAPKYYLTYYTSSSQKLSNVMKAAHVDNMQCGPDTAEKVRRLLKCIQSSSLGFEANTEGCWAQLAKV